MGNDNEALKARTFAKDRRAWLILVIAIIISALWLYNDIHTIAHPPPVAHSVVAENASLAALSYGRIVEERDGQNITIAQLKDQLTALAHEGYKTISMSELRALLSEGKGIPPKSLVLVFEYGYLDYFRLVDPLLEHLGWRATVSLLTTRQQAHDTTYLYWDRLRKMVNSGRWEIATMGHKSMDTVPIDGSGNVGRFAFDRAWLAQNNRLESDEEMSKRIVNDFDKSRSYIEKQGFDAIATSYPFGLSMPVASKIIHQFEMENINNVKPKLAFINNIMGLNDHYSNPVRLNKLHIARSWTGKVLLDRIQVTTRPTLDLGHNVWLADRGDMINNPHHLTLTGGQTNSLWLAGSQWAGCWKFSAKVRAKHGEWWISQRDWSTGAEWRFGGGAEGLSIRLTSPQGEVLSVAQAAGVGLSATATSLSIIKRGAGVWIELNSQPLFSMPQYLQTAIRGEMGMSAWASSGEADVYIDDVNYSTLPCTTLAINGNPSEAELQTLADAAANLEAINVPVYEINGSAMRALPLDQDLLRVIAHRYALSIVADIKVNTQNTDAENYQAWMDKVIIQITPQEWRGLALRVDVADQTKWSPAWVATLEKLRQRAKGIGKVVEINDSDMLRKSQQSAISCIY